MSKIMKRIKGDLRAMSYAQMEDIADQAGISNSCLWFWREDVTTAPHFTNVEAVAKALGYKISMEIA